MLYQVMIRLRAQQRYTGYIGWEPFAGPTRDPSAALQLVRQAAQRRAEALVVQAEDADDLAELVRHMRALPLPDAPAAVDTADVDLAEVAPREPVAPAAGLAELASFADQLLASWDQQRWTMEQGAGGDHDTPYRFSLPTNTTELRYWLRMMLRYHHTTHTAAES